MTNPDLQRIFVAGGTGVIGCRAVRLFVDAGYDVSVIARSDGKEALVRALGATPATVSLFDPEALTVAVTGHDVVVNLATHIPPASRAASMRAWAENERIRREGSGHLVDAAIGAGARRFIQESLAFQYEGQGERWIDESSPLVDTPFLGAVLAAEAHTERFGASGPERVGVVLRFGQFYAADSNHTQAVLALARRGIAGQPGSREGYTTIIAADDAASAVLAACRAPSGVYNVVDDDPVTREEWGRILAAAVGRPRLRFPPPAMTKVMGSRSRHLVSSQRVSNAAFAAATGWTPHYPSFREGVHLLLAGPDRVDEKEDAS